MLLPALCIILQPSLNSNWSYNPETPNSGRNQWFFCPMRLEIREITLKNNKAPLLTYFKLSASFYIYWWIQTGVTVRKRPIWVKIGDFFVACDLEIWQMTFKNNRAPLLCYFKLCASFHGDLWISTGVTVQKRQNWGKICFDLCDLDLWLLILIFCMDITFIYGNNSWKFHDDKMTGTLLKKMWQTDGQMDRSFLRAAWSQLKTYIIVLLAIC